VARSIRRPAGAARDPGAGVSSGIRSEPISESGYRTCHHGDPPFLPSSVPADPIRSFPFRA
jgi:hypothetical protein